MRSNSSYFYATVVSLVLHGSLVAVVAWGWEFSSNEKNLAKPKYVDVKLVKLTATTPKNSAPKKETKVVNLDEQRKERERLEKLEAQREAETAARLKSQKEKEEKERQEKEKLERERLAREQREIERRRREEELLQQLEQEEELIQGEEDELIAQSVTQAITNRIEERWSRPPSARNGMECELALQLVTNGRVIPGSVTVVKSSGNQAFDESAKQAVIKAEQFPEVQELPIRVFERDFRQFTLVFRPEDLRQ